MSLNQFWLYSVYNCRITFKQDAIMDIFNLNEKVKGLVSYLQDTGYSAMYIDYVKKMAEWLSGNSEHYKWKSLADVEPTLKELWSNKYTCRNKVRLLRVICQYIENGLLPDGCKHYPKGIGILSLRNNGSLYKWCMTLKTDVCLAAVYLKKHWQNWICRIVLLLYSCHAAIKANTLPDSAGWAMLCRMKKSCIRCCTVLLIWRLVKANTT